MLVAWESGVSMDDRELQKLAELCHWYQYTSGEGFVAIYASGGPERNTQIGFGDTREEAVEALESTSVQGDSICDTIEYAVSNGWLDSVDDLEPLDDILSELRRV